MLPIRLWVYKFRIGEGLQTGTSSNPRFGDHDQKDVPPHFKGLTISTLQYKYKPTSKYSRAEIILLLKHYCYYRRKIDLSIGVRITGIPTSTLIALLFCTMRSTLFSIARVTKPETVSTHIHAMSMIFFFSLFYSTKFEK